MPRVADIAIVGALLIAGCAGGSEASGELTVQQPSGDCAAAFRAAAARTSPGPDRLVTSLGALEPTIRACRSFDDWMAGARANLDTLPTRGNPEASLVDLCQSGPSDSPACRELRLGTDAGS